MIIIKAGDDIAHADRLLMLLALYLFPCDHAHMKVLPQSVSYHALPADELVRVFETDAVQGLAQEEAVRRLALFGGNRLAAEKKTKRLLVFLAQFKNPIIYLLLAAAAVSFFFRDYQETVAILVVLFINAFIGYWMEMQAMRSMDALKKFDLVFAKAWRNGRLVEIPSEEIVPGDILFLDAGDIVPADARLLSVSRLEVDESPLTGESVPVQKSTDPLPEGTLAADRINMVFKGTALTKGNGNALVVGTGMHTELGRISGLVRGAGKEEIPLNVKLNAFSRKLIWIFVPVVLLFFLFSVIRGSDLLAMLKVSIALAVAAIPEGLPIVATITLARGMLKLAKQQVIVKKLAAVETLGSANVILTDKTGTLTQNRLQVNTICLPGKNIGITWNETEKSISYLPHILSAHEQESLQKLLHVGILCNNASFTDSENPVGDPIEVALLKLGEYHRSGLLSEIARVFSRVYEQPFDSNVKMMGTVHESEGEKIVAVKGATEEVLRHVSYILKDGTVQPLTGEEKKEWADRTDQLASGGLRVLAFAYKDRVPGNNDFMRELIFTGLCGYPRSHGYRRSS
ncbi:MAG: Ca2+-transporting ATPase [Bacteroidetes bacterium]|nr:MAG: Ca2+-transporting ATPase [Bacteroidota bacterium]